MAAPDIYRTYILYTDACNYSIGDILTQTDDSGSKRSFNMYLRL